MGPSVEIRDPTVWRAFPACQAGNRPRLAVLCRSGSSWGAADDARHLQSPYSTPWIMRAGTKLVQVWRAGQAEAGAVLRQTWRQAPVVAVTLTQSDPGRHCAWVVQVPPLATVPACP